jgi:hypothetical protein
MMPMKNEATVFYGKVYPFSHNILIDDEEVLLLRLVRAAHGKQRPLHPLKFGGH